MRYRPLLSFGIAVLLSTPLLSLPSVAENWPQWRGPAFNGSSTESDLPLKWTETDGIKWKAEMPGASGATPIIWDDAVFVSTADADHNLLLLCLDRKTGAEKWRKQVVEAGNIEKGQNNMASPSPVTDGKAVYILFGTGDLAAYDFAGKLLWKRNLGEDYGRFSINWIYGSSPLLFDGRLYIQVLQRTPVPADYPGLAGHTGDRDSYLLALEPASGKTLWKHVRPTQALLESMESYATPVPLTGADGKTQILIVGGDCLTGHDPATGEELWRGNGLNRKHGEWMRMVTSPVAAGTLAVACGAKKEQMLAFRTDLRGDITESGVAWSFDEKKTPDVCTPAYYQGKLYALDGDSQTLTCLDPTNGHKVWQGTLPGRGVIRSSPTAADGRIYIINEKNTVFVCKAGDTFEILATNEMGGPDGTRGAIAVSQGHLFIRTPSELICVGK